MKRLAAMAVFMLIILSVVPLQALGLTLIPGGAVVGLELRGDRVTVAALEENSPAKDAGLREGDCILRIDELPITCAEDVKTALERSHGSVLLTVRRGGEEKTIRVVPAITPDGPKLGAYLKQGITGIGTVTFYDPQTLAFAALGHGVSDPGGVMAPMREGFVYSARIHSVRRGRVGDPAQLLGTVTDRTPLGTLEKNTARGVFGHLQSVPAAPLMETAEADRIHTGPATIRSNIRDGHIQEYSVEILRIYPTQKENGRNLLLKVTDPALLEATGGIVQGMSGSPIIQDGKLIGAVTHVLVNDPTTGYGIFIENMLDVAS